MNRRPNKCGIKKLGHFPAEQWLRRHTSPGTRLETGTSSAEPPSLRRSYIEVTVRQYFKIQIRVPFFQGRPGKLEGSYMKRYFSPS